MFNNESNRKAEPVHLVLTDGRVISGTLFLPITSDIRRALGGDTAVVEFQHDSGEISLVAKAHVVEIILVNETRRAMEKEAA
jgi:hypothetical protein